MTRFMGLAAGLAASLVVGASMAQTPPDVAPQWLKRPSRGDLLAVWPKRALVNGVGGRAEIRCKVSEQGALFDCEVMSERPQGAGFGQAAIALSPQFLLKPAMKDGQPVVGMVQIPVVFPRPDNPTGSHLPAGNGFYSGQKRDVTVSNVSWVAAPSYDDVVAAYPKKAAAEGVGGRATLNCRFRRDGSIKGCKVIEEAPRARGFGVAAQALSRSFRASDGGPGGEALDGAFTQITITFAPDMLHSNLRPIGRAKWLTLPSPEAFRAAYPAAAAAAKVGEGRAVLECKVAAAGALQNCAVEREDPPDLGFGQAALSLAPGFRLNVWTVEGLPVIGGDVRVPVRYAGPETSAGEEN